MHPTRVTHRAARRIGRAILIALAALLLSKNAEAAPSCTITPTGVSFGSYDVFNVTATDSTGSITFKCKGSAANITVTISKGGSASFTPRLMTGGTDSLSYNLYLDAARSTIWGDGTGGTQSYANAAPPNNLNVVVTIYARVTAGQDVSAGSYSDSVTAIINF